MNFQSKSEKIDLLFHIRILLENKDKLNIREYCLIEEILEQFKSQNISENETFEINLEIQKIKEIVRQNLLSSSNQQDKQKWNYDAKINIQKSLKKPPCWSQSAKFIDQIKNESERNFFDKKQTQTQVSKNAEKQNNFDDLSYGKVQKSCNNFTTGLDEFYANNQKNLKKGLYKDFQPFLGKKHDDKNNIDKEASNAPVKRDLPGVIVKNNFFGSQIATNEKTETFQQKKRAFKPPVKEEPKKQESETTKPKTPLTEFAEAEGLDYGLVEAIEHEILDKQPMVSWSDIAGLEDVKKIVNETIIFPHLRPDIFTGLRKPARGILLFGPPGTGKTMIGRAIAGQLNSTFFSISSSSLVSKWVGESEKLIKTLFKMAVFMQPSVIFVDEIDSLLSVRGDSEADVVRRIKTEFFVQIDGAKTSEDDKILIVGTTNRPEQLDEAARRRFVKRLYIPLPDKHARLELLKALIAKEKALNVKMSIDDSELDHIVDLSRGYSCADIVNMMKEAAMGPIRDLMGVVGIQNCQDWNIEEIRPLKINDLMNSLQRVKTSVSPDEIVRYKIWNQQFGLFDIAEE